MILAQKPLEALFTGETYIDVTFLTDRLPTDDEKHVASAYAVSLAAMLSRLHFAASAVPAVLFAHLHHAQGTTNRGS